MYLRERIFKSDFLTLFSSVSGTVQLAKDTRTGMNVAIKQMVIAKQAKKEVLTNEILIMKESHHENIVNFLDAYMVDGEIWVSVYVTVFKFVILF